MRGPARALALAAAALAAPRPAAACEKGDSLDFIAPMLVAGGGSVVNLGLSIHDLAVDDSSSEYAGIEVVVTVPQLVVGGWLTKFAIEHGETDGMVLSAAYTLWVGALALHGIHELSEGDDRPAARRARARAPRLVVAPTAVTDGVELGTGLGVGGVF